MILATVLDAFKQWWEIWWVYYVFGYAGSYLHLYFKVPKGIHLFDWLKENTREFVASIVCYNLCIFLWADGTLDMFGLKATDPNGWTFVIAYFGQSIIMAVLFKWGDLFDKMIAQFRGNKDVP